MSKGVDSPELALAAWVVLGTELMASPPTLSVSEALLLLGGRCCFLGCSCFVSRQGLALYPILVSDSPESSCSSLLSAAVPGTQTNTQTPLPRKCSCWDCTRDLGGHLSAYLFRLHF